jgi:hypothetical protein
MPWEEMSLKQRKSACPSEKNRRERQNSSGYCQNAVLAWTRTKTYIIHHSAPAEIGSCLVMETFLSRYVSVNECIINAWGHKRSVHRTIIVKMSYSNFHVSFSESSIFCTTDGRPFHRRNFSKQHWLITQLGHFYMQWCLHVTPPLVYSFTNPNSNWSKT